MTLADLKAAIDGLLNHPAGVGHYDLVSNVPEKAYEAYIFGLCIRASRELGASPELKAISAPADPFIFRGGPGGIYSSYRNYGYVSFALNGHRFEIHANVEISGTSGMTHELDVCLIRGNDADACRSKALDPKSSCVVAGWECKFYGGPLDKGLGRAFVGLMDDMGGNVRVCGLCSNSSHAQLKDYFRPQRRPRPHFDLTPINGSNESIFVNVLKAELQKATAL